MSDGQSLSIKPILDGKREQLESLQIEVNGLQAQYDAAVKREAKSAAERGAERAKQFNNERDLAGRQNPFTREEN